jgi:hypothetical protein
MYDIWIRLRLERREAHQLPVAATALYFTPHHTILPSLTALRNKVLVFESRLMKTTTSSHCHW